MARARRPGVGGPGGGLGGGRIRGVGGGGSKLPGRSVVKKLETQVRKDNIVKGDAVSTSRVTEKISNLKAQKDAGLITQREHIGELNKMTQSHKDSVRRAREIRGKSRAGSNVGKKKF